jgi:F-type H+-transporting ATPase subunit gamma
MVAASKLRQAQNQVAASRPYFEILYQTISDIVRFNRDLSSPYLKPGKEAPVLFVVIAGDRGLAGGYNSNVIKLCQQQMSGKEAVVLPIGRKALDAFRSAGIARHTEAYAEAAEITVGECFSVAKTVAKAFREGVYSEVYLVYTHFVSVLSQSPKSMKLLPLEAPVDGEPVQIKSDTVYEPSLEEVFDAIVPEYLGGILYGAVCESRCAEQAARRTAMDSATQNAEDMIADLTLKYNRARQAAITQEITEIVAGTNA